MSETAVEKTAEKKEDIRIRWMIRHDMPEVLTIETSCFEFPWLEEDFTRCLKQRNCIGMVAECCLDGAIVGFMVCELYGKSINLLNIAVTKKMQKKGIGTAMVQKLIGKLYLQRRKKITVGAPDASRSFFEKCGFSKTDSLSVELLESPAPIAEDPRLCVRMIMKPEDKYLIVDAFPKAPRFLARSSDGENKYHGLIAFAPSVKAATAFSQAIQAIRKLAQGSGQQDDFRPVIACLKTEKIKEAEFEGPVVGFVLTTPIEPRTARITIKKIVVAPKWKREEELVKKALLGGLADRVQCLNDGTRLFADIQKRDLPLFESLGFKQMNQAMEYALQETS